MGAGITLMHMAPPDRSTPAGWGAAIIVAFAAGVLALFAAAINAGFDRSVGDAARDAWPFVAATIAFWTVAAACALRACAAQPLPAHRLGVRALGIGAVALITLAAADAAVATLLPDAGAALLVVIGLWLALAFAPVRRLLRV
jgi:hypothetical protein